MEKNFAIVLFCAYLSSAFTAPIVQDEDGNQYYLVSIEDISSVIPSDEEHEIRQKRKLSILEEDYLLKTGVIARGPGPIILGGKVRYEHVPSGSNFHLAAANSRYHGKNLGTQVNADGRLNLWRNKDARVDAVGSYERNFGGIGGTGKPDYYTGIEISHKI